MSARIHPLHASGVPRLAAESEALEGGDLILRHLEQLGVDYVFGIPGGAIEPLYNALARSERRGGIRSVVARHETGAAFMAEGYARNTGKLGVCCSTTGPGATNLITGVASAYENQIPLLVITPQTALSHFGRKALQESSDTAVNTVGMFQHCTHYNTLVSHVDQLEHKLASAIMTAFTAHGPAHISVPLDIMRSTLERSAPGFNLASLLARPAWKDEGAIDTLVDLLLDARKPVFVLGNGCQEAAGLILRTAMILGAQVVTTPDGKGLISPFHPNYRGVFSFAGHQSAEHTLQDPQVDLVVTVGNMLSEWSSNNWDREALLTGQLVHIDTNENNLTRSPMARLHVRGSIDTVFETLIVELARHGRQLPTQELPRPDSATAVLPFEVDDLAKCLDASCPIKPQWLMTKLTQLFPPNTRYLADAGNSFAWSTHYLHPFDRRVLDRRSAGRGDRGRRTTRGGLFQAGFEFAPMGWAIGNAIGAALARPGDPVVCITGDGSMLMSGQEITVAQQRGLPVVYIVLNDARLGMVAHGQRLGGGEQIGCELPQVDFRRMAEAMGIRAYLIQTPQDLMNLNIPGICQQRSPTLLDVRIDQREIPPIGRRIQVLREM
ncbi:MAG: Acetolactate synthase isozyme 2 large subunit [Pseudomonadales bacterium]|nr:Acetolactate synthase isozyme 2 large subunit [Pseudomonadales bacterium]